MNNQRVRPETNGAGNGGRERPEGVLAPAEQTALAALAAQREGMRVNAQTGTTYTFALADTYELGTALNTFANASPVTAYIPKNSVVAIPIGHRIECEATGAG